MIGTKGGSGRVRQLRRVDITWPYRQLGLSKLAARRPERALISPILQETLESRMGRRVGDVDLTCLASSPRFVQLESGGNCVLPHAPREDRERSLLITGVCRRRISLELGQSSLLKTPRARLTSREWLARVD